MERGWKLNDGTQMTPIEQTYTDSYNLLEGCFMR